MSNNAISLSPPPNKHWRKVGIDFFLRIHEAFPSITPFEILIIQVLDCYRMFDSPVCDTYVSQLATVLNCDKGTVSNSMDNLHAKGVLIKSKYPTKEGKTACKYDLSPLIDKLWAIKAPTKGSKKPAQAPTVVAPVIEVTTEDSPLPAFGRGIITVEDYPLEDEIEDQIAGIRAQQTDAITKLGYSPEFLKLNRELNTQIASLQSQLKKAA